MEIGEHPRMKSRVMLMGPHFPEPPSNALNDSEHEESDEQQPRANVLEKCREPEEWQPLANVLEERVESEERHHNEDYSDSEINLLTKA